MSNNEWGGVGSNRETHMFLVNAENDAGAWARLRDTTYTEITDEPEITDEDLGSFLVATFAAYLNESSQDWASKVRSDVGDWSKINRAEVGDYLRDDIVDMLRGTIEKED